MSAPSTTNVTTVSSSVPETLSAEVPVKRQQGRGAKQKKEFKFREKKNSQFSSALNTTMLRRLNLTDPTSISAINIQSAVVPLSIPISYRGLPKLAETVWCRMKSIGTRPFSQLATDENFAIFLKCLMYISEAKLCFAQSNCTNHPVLGLPSITTFTEMQLRLLKTVSCKLPYPLAVYVEAVGNFEADGQPVVPTLITTIPSAASGAISYAPSMIRELVHACRNPIPVDNVVATIANRIDDLPYIEWVPGHVAVQVPPVEGEAQPDLQVPAVSVSPRTLEFWGAEFLSARERDTFHRIISSMDSKRGFNILVDIASGDGSPVQAIRFPDEYDADELSTRYYTNTKVPQFEEQLAPALMLGFEYQGERNTRLSGNHDTSLMNGTASTEAARYALAWFNVE